MTTWLLNWGWRVRNLAVETLFHGLGSLITNEVLTLTTTCGIKIIIIISVHIILCIIRIIIATLTVVSIFSSISAFHLTTF